MVWKDCGGRECKVGWGYNEHLDVLISVEPNSPVKSTTKNDWQYFIYDVSATSVPYFVSFSLIC